MKTYSFDINKTITQLIPWFLRKPVITGFAQCLCVPLKTMYADFLTYRQATLRNATIDSTVIRLTQALQDEFNNTGIYILHPNDPGDESFIYLRQDHSIPEFIYLGADNHTPVVYIDVSNIYTNSIDFTVRVPVALAAQVNQIYAFVKKHVYSSINFNIQTF
jgi:hypothetical protein